MADFEQPTIQSIQEPLHREQDNVNGIEHSHAHEYMQTANSPQGATDRLKNWKQPPRGETTAVNTRHPTAQQPNDRDQEPQLDQQNKVNGSKSSRANQITQSTLSVQSTTNEPKAQRPPKKIIVCCDGTMNNDTEDKKLTNVVRLAHCITPVDGQGVIQSVHYQPGVGTGTGRLRNLRESITGKGRSMRICLIVVFFISGLSPAR